MADDVLALLGEPAVSAGAAVLAALAAATAAVILPLGLSAIRRRLDAIEAAQAETAAYLAGEIQRLTRLLAQQRAALFKQAVRRPALHESQRPEAAKRPGVMDGIHQPLRKTVH
ncbi:MAG: hypothetical protein RIM80_28080 [Alphaproteobacteria bacterium]